ncbi:MAG: hypothetical protein UY74_C0068G0007 [Candidatus Kaiserbacteria bacterium GW2011_GWC2_52_8b]|uniref:Small ribosomal subunit protein bS6 n=2 Tax=Candidatus Kaiseribacteriota TaxID=1752734 RepID=A0A0G1XEF5_9BACT|nr:MAG: hypothetical protein UY67_C0024G0027 [Candidatus Kaiserbacteria bacterium GW2011_GWA2_52_12]KKW29628.1 MAG: hypothetical protein UY74_C0068G0007 [Candidatus Kaiserbacteria bacterium GW2011_GWC2_52_8b]
MVEADIIERTDTEPEVAASRVYEIGYHISPSIKDEDIEKVVGSIRSVIEKAGGSFIAEGAPALARLAYPISIKENGKRVEYDRGHFGWIKFESSIEGAQAISEAIKRNSDLLRTMIFQTVREDTRAKIKIAPLREVKRTDVIKAAPRRAEESAPPVSEADLDKALLDITGE